MSIELKEHNIHDNESATGSPAETSTTAGSVGLTWKNIRESHDKAPSEIILNMHRNAIFIEDLLRIGFENPDDIAHITNLISMDAQDLKRATVSDGLGILEMLSQTKGIAV